MNKITTRHFFIVTFIVLASYYLLIKAELYESKAAVIVRDLSSTSSFDGFSLALLGGGTSSQLQDSMVVEEYLKSLDVFTLLDSKFQLIEHFKSEKLDIFERLSSSVSMEEILEFYQNRLVTDYDTTSGILYVAYAHTEPEISKQILEFLIKHVESKLNEFNRRKARKQLKFIELQHKKQKEKLAVSSAAFEHFQNEHLIFDPNQSAVSASGIIANLEASLTQKRIELSTLRGYLSEDNYEIKKVKGEISSIEHSITQKKQSLSGKEKQRLNKILFEYEKLKMALEFDTEVYKNTLIQLESTKLDASKEAKTLSVVTKPNLPDGYTYPNKPQVFISLLILMLMGYGIVSMLVAIIRDHKE